MASSPITKWEDKIKLHNEYLKSKEMLVKRDNPTESTEPINMCNQHDDLKCRLNFFNSKIIFIIKLTKKLFS